MTPPKHRLLLSVTALGLLGSCGSAVGHRSADPQIGQTHTTAGATVVPPSIPLLAKGVDFPPAYIQSVARSSYVWGWPLVNMLNRRATVTQAPEPGRLNGVLPVAPRGRLSMLTDYIEPTEHFVACPNQDVVYGLGYFALDEEPVVIQVPEFGNRFWVYAMYDVRTDQFGELGQQYGTKPGFYLLTGPKWKGQPPRGITGVIRSSSELAAAIPRVFMDDTPEDKKAIQPIINQIVAYPLAEFDGEMKTVDWVKAPNIPGPKDTGGETKWVIPERFFDDLRTVMNKTPPIAGEEAVYANIDRVLDAASQAPSVNDLLVKTGVDNEQDLIEPLFPWRQNGVPAGNGWNRSVNNAAFGFDYYARASTAKSNMFENRAVETQYFYTDDESKGAPLDGASEYAIHFPPGQLPPVNGFWSLTLYNDKHLFHPNQLHRFSLGTKSKSLVPDADGGLTLYAGARSPGADKEANWLPAPAGPISLYIRAYWSKEPILNQRS